MSTYYNEQTGKYENYEAGVMRALEKIDGALSGLAGEETDTENAETQQGGGS